MTPALDLDRIESATDRIKQDEFLADKKRFESFKLGKVPPAGLSSHSKRHSHSRSHSRNVSVVSISPSPSLPLSIPSHDVSLSSGSISSLSQLSSTPAAAKRGSHHRRCSSLSTRRDSAEVMGVSLPALSTSSSEDNISLGDKDSLRRRALWALEGKPSPDGFSPVEIPELNTPEIERRISELPSKPSFPPPMASFSSGLSGLANMRDSFGNRPSSSIKDQLHTLVEEEEEEEEEEVPQGPSSPPASPDFSPPAIPTSPTPSRARHRPAGLSLRPLSLSPEKLLSTTNGELPTPAPTPNPSKLSGLKSLTLTASPPNLITSPPSDSILSGATALHRRCVVAPSIITSSASLFRRRSTDNVSSGSSDPFEAPRRRSSISYKSSFHGLPTPELTPTTDHRTSIGSDSDCSRPSSVSNEQHFLYQSQATLIARISELERALAFRTQSCPVSLAASDNSLGPAPTDDVLSLIADLKAERDELRRDIDGWRTRVADLQKQIGALTHRVDAERQEAWLARERAGLLEIKNRAAIRDAEESAAAVSGLKDELVIIGVQLQAMLDEAARNKEAALELERVEVELAEERRRRAELEKILEELSLNASTPVVSARRVMSIDSMSSATDVESLDGYMLTGCELKAVQEVDEDEESCSDQENHLIGYEDEEEGDESFISHDGSSFSSLEDIPRSTVHLVPSGVSSPSRTSSPASNSTHARHYSLSREWSFPLKGVPHSVSSQHAPEEVDRFFGCLEDLGDSPPTPAAAPETTNPFSRSFFSAIEDDCNGLPPFVLPTDVGTEVDSPPTEDSSLYAEPGLDVVLEEEEPEEVMDVATEDEFIGEEDEGGIRFTFMVPPGFASPESSETPSTTPVLTPVGQKTSPFHEPAIENNDDTPFPFSITSLVSRPRASPPSPSAIPRATVLKRFEGPAKDAKYSVSCSPLVQLPASQHTSPSNTYDVPRPSCLPQRITKPASAPTYIPQPTTRVRASSSMSSVQSRSQPPSDETAMRSSSTDASPGVGVRPFAALQNLASLVPLPSPFSWSGMRAVPPETPSTGECNNNCSRAEEHKKGFVSKERQLARLRERMAAEKNTILADAPTRSVKQQQSVSLPPCKRCVDRVVAP